METMIAIAITITTSRQGDGAHDSKLPMIGRILLKTDVSMNGGLI